MNQKEDIPNDADGDAIRRVIKHGSDLSKPMGIDFAVAVPSEAAGLQVAQAASELGYHPEVSYDEDDEAWTCYCSKSMLLTYAGVVEAQIELARISEPFDSAPDGWGTFGNVEQRG